MKNFKIIVELNEMETVLYKANSEKKLDRLVNEAIQNRARSIKIFALNKETENYHLVDELRAHVERRPVGFGRWA